MAKMLVIGRRCLELSHLCGPYRPLVLGSGSVAGSVAKLGQTRPPPAPGLLSSASKGNKQTREWSGLRGRGLVSTRRPPPGPSWSQIPSGEMLRAVSEWSLRGDLRDSAPTSSHHQSFNDSTPSGSQVIKFPQRDTPSSSPWSPRPPVGSKTTNATVGRPLPQPHTSQLPILTHQLRVPDRQLCHKEIQSRPQQSLAASPAASDGLPRYQPRRTDGHDHSQQDSLPEQRGQQTPKRVLTLAAPPAGGHASRKDNAASLEWIARPMGT